MAPSTLRRLTTSELVLMMDFWADINWYAIQAKPYREKLAAASVAEFGAEVFFPRAKQEQLVCGAPRLVTKPLFPGYFFARFCPLRSMDAVRYAKGVLRVLGTSNRPLPVEAEIVAGIRERVQADGLVPLQKNEFHPGDSVSIERGPLSGWMGRVEREWDDGNRVLILLEAVHQARLLIEKNSLAVYQSD